jgi:hypothetical protein
LKHDSEVQPITLLRNHNLSPLKLLENYRLTSVVSMVHPPQGEIGKTGDEKEEGRVILRYFILYLVFCTLYIMYYCCL